jgi:hypothetical protein
MKTVYFVISLPRTGTKSLCRMAHECGITFRHAPINTFQRELENGKNFFADTPCFVPSFIEKVLEIENINPKFIYIDRDFTEVFESWKKVNLHLNYTRMYNQYTNEETRSSMPKSTLTDILSLHECFNESYMDNSNYLTLFESHKQKVLSIIRENNKELLIYNFQDGWEPFCNFLGCDKPSVEIPHLNIETMFEKIL